MLAPDFIAQNCREHKVNVAKIGLHFGKIGEAEGFCCTTFRVG